MSNTFSSPSVSANEIDQSFSATEGPSNGAALVGTTPKGPAFKPVVVRKFDEFRQVFGELDPAHPLTFAAFNYLKNGSSLRVIRVLGNDDGTSTQTGYNVDGIVGISDVSGAIGATGSILAEIHYSGTKPTVVGVASDANRFVISFGSVFSATASFQTSSADYIGKVLNTDPTKYSTYYHYVSSVYKYQPQAASASWWSVSTLSASWKTFDRDHEQGQTPWFKSQLLGGQEFDLFKLFTRADGRSTNDDVKVTIANVRPSANPTIYPYGTFDLAVRDFNDSDTRPVVLESFTGLNFDPDDRNYILRKIGDVNETFSDTERKFQVTDGSWPGSPGSRYIRVKLSDSNFPAEALPWGHRGFPKLLYSGSAGTTGAGGQNKVPDLIYNAFQRDSQGNPNDLVCFGVLFVSGGVADRMRAFPDIPTSDAAMTGSDAGFSLKGLTSFSDNGTTRWYWSSAGTTYQPLYASGSVQKFTVPFYGGFDGWDLRVQNPIGQWTLANDALEASSIGVVSLKRAIDVIRNPDLLDMNVLAIPGVHNKRVTDYARSMANERKDVLYIVDVTGSTVSEVESALTAREIDDNYAACYYPDVKQEHPNVPGRLVRVPASVAAIAAIGYTDRVAQPFFAPAGMNRGGLTDNFGIKDVVDRLDFKDRDRLYDARINPIGTFTKEGVVIYGQKTLQARPSALDRVNVRRLLILAKKSVLQEAKELLFEPNNAGTWTRFVNKVNPILDRIRRDQGIERFRVVMDSTTNTPDIIDRNAMYGKIILQPTKAVEFVSIDFVITNAGVAFGS